MHVQDTLQWWADIVMKVWQFGFNGILQYLFLAVCVGAIVALINEYGAGVGWRAGFVVGFALWPLLLPFIGILCVPVLVLLGVPALLIYLFQTLFTRLHSVKKPLT